MGALSNALDKSSVCPYQLDVDESTIKDPLAQFQATCTEEASTLELLRSINDAASHTLSDSQLAMRFEGLWSRFEQMLESVPELEGEGQGPTRSTNEILEVLVGTVRTADRRILDLYTWLESLEALTSEKRPDPRPVQHPPWPELIAYLKRRRHALTAAVYGKAAPVWDGDRLLLIFPEEQSFHVGMARESGHQERLLDAVEDFCGVRPKEITALAQGGPLESPGS